MTSTVPVAGRTVIYPAGQQSGLTLKNVGTETIYLDSQSNVNAGGWPLGIGSSISWDPNRPLFAYAVNNGQLLISENAGNLFDAQAVAAGILDGGLASQIANSISLKGVPIVTRQTILKSGTLAPNASSGNIPLDDIYGSVQVLIARGTPGVQKTRTLWASINGGSSPVWVGTLNDSSCRATMVVPTQQNFCEVATDFNNPEPIEYWVTAITAVVPQAYENRGDNSYSGGASLNIYTKVGNATVIKATNSGASNGRIYLKHRGGRAFWSLKTLGGGGSFDFFNPENALYNSVARIETSSGSATSGQIALPNMPLGLYYSFSSGLTSAELSIVYQD